MTAPTFTKKRLDSTTDATNVKYGAPDWTYAVDVLDGTHASHRIQVHNIEGIAAGQYDVVVYQSGTGIYARRSDGVIISSGLLGTDDTIVIQHALDQAVVSTGPPLVTKPTTIWIKPGLYLVGLPRPTAHSNTTIIGYGATIRETELRESPLQADLGIQNWTLLGITFDLNEIGAPVFCRGTETDGGCKNILVKDCTFLKPMNRAYTDASNRALFVTYTMPQGVGGGFPTKWNENIRWVNCDFDCYIEPIEPPPPGITSVASQSIAQFANCRNVLVQGCRFYNASIRANAALSLFNNNYDVVVAYNQFINNDVQDINVTQNGNVRIVGNECDSRIELADVRYVDIIGNRVKLIKIEDLDEELHDNFPSLYRGTRHLNIAYNSFNVDPQAPATIGTAFQWCIVLDLDATETNAPKDISIIGNEARAKRMFFNTTLPPATMTVPAEDIIISGNLIGERTETSTNSGAPINIQSNASVPQGGFKNIFITGNYFPPYVSASAPYDVDLGGTLFENIVIRNNFFNANSVNNINT